MNTLKIKIAFFLAVAVVTFVISQGIVFKNIDMLHGSLNKSVDIVQDMHVAESFHSSMHSMIISASAFSRSKEPHDKEEYAKALQEGEKAIAQLMDARPRQGDAADVPRLGGHSHDSRAGEIVTNLGKYFEELKATLAPVVAEKNTDDAQNIAKANHIFDEVFHRYYINIHKEHYDALNNMRDDAHKAYTQSIYIYLSQFILALGIGMLMVVFAERVFFRIYKLTEQHAFTDSLTALYNRRYLDTMLADELDTTKIQDMSCSLVLLDVDDFKKFNDTQGHVAGDKLLKDLAAVLRQTVRKADKLIRYGGEEFLVVLFETDKRQAASVAEKIREAVQNHMFILPDGPHAPRVTISLGVASLAEHGGSITQGVKAADVLLYAAKRKGKNKVCSDASDEIS